MTYYGETVTYSSSSGHGYCPLYGMCVQSSSKCPVYGRKEEPKKEEKKVANKKYYKVVKETPAWERGAILECDGDGGYKAINDLWDKIENNGDYVEIKKVVEGSDFFERVYAMGKASKMLFVTKEKAQEMASKYFTQE